MKAFLRQEACLFERAPAPLGGKAPDDAFVLLVERVEDAIAKERAQTIEMRTSRAPEEQQDKGSGAQSRTQTQAPPQGAAAGTVT